MDSECYRDSVIFAWSGHIPLSGAAGVYASAQVCYQSLEETRGAEDRSLGVGSP